MFRAEKFHNSLHPGTYPIWHHHTTYEHTNLQHYQYSYTKNISGYTLQLSGTVSLGQQQFWTQFNQSGCCIVTTLYVLLPCHRLFSLT